MIGVCSCLAGVPCRYNGTAACSKKAMAEYYSNNALLFCPEVLGGLSVPRQPCEIVGGDGLSVLHGKAKVLAADGTDYTEQFIWGAKKACELLILNNITEVYLMAKSPSCGLTHIYDGTFSGTLKHGRGVLAAMLSTHGHFKLLQLFENKK